MIEVAWSTGVSDGGDSMEFEAVSDRLGSVEVSVGCGSVSDG